MKYKSFFNLCMVMFSITIANAQATPKNTDTMNIEDSLRKDRAARADVYVSGKNILSHEPMNVDSANAAKKAEGPCKRKNCRKNRQKNY